MISGCLKIKITGSCQDTPPIRNGWTAAERLPSRGERAGRSLRKELFRALKKVWENVWKQGLPLRPILSMAGQSCVLWRNTHSRKKDIMTIR